MNISAKQLIGLDVYTYSGTKIGTVSDFIIKSDQQVIISFVVSTGFLSGVLNVSPRQVISISDDKMIVDDATISEPIPEVNPVN